MRLYLIPLLVLQLAPGWTGLAADKGLAEPWFQLIREVYRTKPASFSESLSQGMSVLASVTKSGLRAERAGEE